MKNFKPVFHVDTYGAKACHTQIRVLECGQVDVADMYTFRRGRPAVYSFQDAAHALHIWRKWAHKIGRTENQAAIDALRAELERIAEVQQ